MKKTFSRAATLPVLMGALAILAASPLAAAPAAPQVSARLLVDSAEIRPGASFLAGVRLEVAPGWHIYGKEIADGDSGLPTTVEWILPDGFVAGSVKFPPTVPFSSAGGSGTGLNGTVVLAARITPPADWNGDTPIRLAAKASWLACENICVPGSADLTADIGMGEARGALVATEELRRVFGEESGAGNGFGVGFAAALLMAFLGGIVLNLMPCVLPVLSLKLTGLLKGAASDRRERALRGAAYAGGVLVSFWAIAGTLIALRAGGRAAGWGFQFQNAPVVAAAATVFFVVALNLFGVFEAGTGLSALAGGAAAAAGKRGRGFVSSFAGGLFATAAATPCTAPFMGAALGWAIAQPAPAAMAVFTALGIGMAAPVVAVSIHPALARRLPKPGRWMESLRQAMGFPMLATALWMLYLLSRLSGSGAVFVLLAAFFAVAVGAWLFGRWGTPATARRTRIAATAAAVLLASGGFAAALFLTGPDRSDGERTEAAARSGSEPEEMGGWVRWSPAAVAELRSRGTPVFVDFGAEWCLTCKFNEAAVLGTDEIRAKFKELGVTLLKADWTSRDDGIARELEAHGRAGVPMYLLYRPDADAPILLPELLTKGMLLKALEGLPKAP